jgi:hypothetical protein
LERAADRLEAEAWRRAVDGNDDVMTHQGKVIYHIYPTGHPRGGELITDFLGDPMPVVIRRYSDRLLELLLKAARPEKFRENVDIVSTFKGGVQIMGIVDQQSEDAKAL